MEKLLNAIILSIVAASVYIMATEATKDYTTNNACCDCPCCPTCIEEGCTCE